MKKIVEKIHQDVPIKELLKRGFFSGIGWAAGVTVGFAIISTVLIIILRQIVSIPLIGSWIATIVQVTLEQLAERSPIFLQ